MNFYGPESRDEHTLSGRLIPLMDAFWQAIQRAIGRPVSPPKYSAALPGWCHEIADQFGKTIFKKLIGAAPSNKFDPRSYGRLIGMILRGVAFIFRDAPAVLRREGLMDLSPEQTEKVEKAAGTETVLRVASEHFQKPISNEDGLIDVGAARLDEQVTYFMSQVGVALKHLINGSVQDQYEFLCGIPEGFIGLVNLEGEFSGKKNRHEMYMLLLRYWPEIAEMQRQHPPKTRRFLFEWLEEQEGRQEAFNQDSFNELCGDIGLDLAPPGHPRNDPA